MFTVCVHACVRACVCMCVSVCLINRQGIDNTYKSLGILMFARGPAGSYRSDFLLQHLLPFISRVVTESAFFVNVFN